MILSVSVVTATDESVLDMERPVIGMRNYLIQENKNEGVGLLGRLAEPGEEARHQFAGLGEELAEQAVRVHLYQLRVCIPAMLCEVQGASSRAPMFAVWGTYISPLTE